MKGFFGCLLFVFCGVFLTIAIFDIISINDILKMIEETKKILSHLTQNSTQREIYEKAISEYTKEIFIAIFNLIFKLGVCVASIFIFVDKIKKID